MSFKKIIFKNFKTTNLLVILISYTFYFFVIKSNCYAENFKLSSFLNFQLDIKTEPDFDEWQRFHAISFMNKNTLWNDFKKQHISLKDWHWVWKMGWLISCEQAYLDKNYVSYCEDVIMQGLNDKALVVRAKSIEIIGIRYENTSNKQVVDSLVKEFNNPKNYKNHEPLYIQKSILRSLKKIGGYYAIKHAQKLAQNNSLILDYWNKISKF